MEPARRRNSSDQGARIRIAPVGRRARRVNRILAGVVALVLIFPLSHAPANSRSGANEVLSNGGPMKIKRSYISKTVAGCFLLVSSGWAFTQSLVPKDPGVRGGLANTGGGLQQQGIPIPHPPLLSPNPTTGAVVNPNEQASFEEGI